MTLSQHPECWPGTAMQSRTIWGLDISRLHEQFWAAHGVQLVRTDEPPSINLSARAYLLLDSALMVLFHPSEIFDRSNRLTADLIYLRLHDGGNKVSANGP